MSLIAHTRSVTRHGGCRPIVSPITQSSVLRPEVPPRVAGNHHRAGHRTRSGRPSFRALEPALSSARDDPDTTAPKPENPPGQEGGQRRRSCRGHFETRAACLHAGAFEISSQDTRPRRKPCATACARSRTPSLRNSRRAWVLTVSSERESSRPIWPCSCPGSSRAGPAAPPGSCTPGSAGVRGVGSAVLANGAPARRPAPGATRPSAGSHGRRRRSPQRCCRRRPERRRR